jgi:hypothetical protein
VYTHRWIELDGSGAITSYSPPFTFEHRGIEYASGLCASGTDGVIVTYGCEDREARWVELGWSDVLAAIGRAS